MFLSIVSICLISRLSWNKRKNTNMKLLLSLLPFAAIVLGQRLEQDQIPFEEVPIDYAELEAEDFLAVEPLSQDAIPLLGFGTWRLTENTSEAVSWAIQEGYTHIDCAAAYGNEKEVGHGIRDGLDKTGLTRDDLFITSKLWNDQ